MLEACVALPNDTWLHLHLANPIVGMRSYNRPANVRVGYNKGLQ
jgi:hypothetical protein